MISSSLTKELILALIMLILLWNGFISFRYLENVQGTTSVDLRETHHSKRIYRALSQWMKGKHIMKHVPKNLRGTTSVDLRETHYVTCTKEFTGHYLSGP